VIIECSKGYAFVTPSQVVSLGEDRTGIAVADPKAASAFVVTAG
jgi:hypothetical protein